MRLLAAILIATSVFGQTVSEPEIAGSVTEIGSESPLAAAEVELREFVLVEGFVTPKVIGTVLTNSRGEFSFKPGHLGNFLIETKKIGYEDSTLRTGTPSAEMTLDLTEQNRRASIKLQLMRPGEIVGRVVDTDSKPVASMRMTMETPGQIPAAFETDSKGEFRVRVAPGPYIIQTASKTNAIDLNPREPREPATSTRIENSDAEFQIVDEGYESLYWPGGVSARDSALPIQVPPGAQGNFGTLTVRKVPKYRARISIEGECAAGTSRNFMVVPTPSVNPPSSFKGSNCEKEFLVGGLEPGDHVLAMWSKQQWGEARLTITDHNIAAKLTMSPSVEIAGRLLVPEDIKLASLGPVGILLTSNLRPVLGLPVAPDAEGKFVFKDVLWSQQALNITLRNPDTYVKQIRYGGVPLNGITFDVLAGSALEVLLDTNAASVSGTVMQSGKPARAIVYVARLPLDSQQYVRDLRPTSEDGKFLVSSLAPGEYRVVALPLGTPRPVTLDRMLAEGMQIKVERGEKKIVDLKIRE